MKINLEIVKLLFEIIYRLFQIFFMFFILIFIFEFIWNGQYIQITNLDTGKETTITTQGLKYFFYDE
jgi:hypothetical protein